MPEPELEVQQSNQVIWAWRNNAASTAGVGQQYKTIGGRDFESVLADATHEVICNNRVIDRVRGK